MDHHIKLVLFVTFVSKQITPERRSQGNLLECVTVRESIYKEVGLNHVLSFSVERSLAPSA